MERDWAAKARELVNKWLEEVDGNAADWVTDQGRREFYRLVEAALCDAARVPEVNASSLLAEVLEECGIRTGTTIDRKDLENMAVSLGAKLSALAQPTPTSRASQSCTASQFS